MCEIQCGCTYEVNISQQLVMCIHATQRMLTIRFIAAIGSIVGLRGGANFDECYNIEYRMGLYYTPTLNCVAYPRA